MTRNRLYLLLGIAVTAGYGWLVYGIYTYKQPAAFTPCVFKNATGIACPSCGSTRSVLSIIQGDIAKAMLINPLGLVITAIMIAVPLWLFFDITSGKSTLYTNYRAAEIWLSKKWIAAPLIAIVLINWIWNIYKNL